MDDISNFRGESWEKGTITIEKESFTITKIEKNSYRNKEYNYLKNNNYVLSERKFTAEFVSGNLVAEYVSINGKYYLNKLLHQFTNDFLRT